MNKVNNIAQFRLKHSEVQTQFGIMPPSLYKHSKENCPLSYTNTVKNTAHFNIKHNQEYCLLSFKTQSRILHTFISKYSQEYCKLSYKTQSRILPTLKES